MQARHCVTVQLQNTVWRQMFIHIFSRANQATMVMSNAIAIAVPAATITTDSIVGSPAKYVPAAIPVATPANGTGIMFPAIIAAGMTKFVELDNGMP